MSPWIHTYQITVEMTSPHARRALTGECPCLGLVRQLKRHLPLKGAKEVLNLMTTLTLTGLNPRPNQLMPEPIPPTQEQTDTYNSLRLLQINLNKSEKAHLDIINEELSMHYDIVLIQEPYTTTSNGVRSPPNFRLVCPSYRFQSEDQIRSAIYVNKTLKTDDWIILDIPNTNDITAIQLKGPYGKLSIFNIYNDCTHSRNEAHLRRFINDHSADLIGTENHHMLWAGDFNRHHLLWDRDEDTHLFTQEAMRSAERLIETCATYELAMALPKGLPTLQHMVTKKYSRPDNVFATPGLLDMVTKCKVDPAIHPTSTDHFPIVTNITLPQERINTPPSYNFREADWEVFRRTLRTKLRLTPQRPVITSLQQLEEAAAQLTTSIQIRIQENVKKSKPRPDAKRWWNSDLERMRKELNRLRADSYRYRALADDPSHQLLKDKSNRYGEAIIDAKRQHWANYLEEMTQSDIWTANKYIKEPVGDGGCPRIPTLRFKDNRGIDVTINNNEDKAKVFAKTFFPPPPELQEDYEHYEYPEPLPDPPKVTPEQVRRHIARLSPYKAYGPDGIPNIVLQKCTDIILDRLVVIF